MIFHKPKPWFIFTVLLFLAAFNIVTVNQANAASQLLDTDWSTSPVPYWHQTLGQGLTDSIKDLTIHVKNPNVDAFYSADIYGYLTSDYATGYGMQPIEAYHFTNLGSPTPAGFDGYVKLTLSSSLPFALSPNRYYKLSINAGDMSRSFYISGAANDNYSNGKAYYYSYSNNACGSYSNPETTCEPGANNGIADIYFKFGTAETLSGKESLVISNGIFSGIDGDYIVETDNGGGLSNGISAYNILTGQKIRITENKYIHPNPVISGHKIAWGQAAKDNGWHQDVFVYDLDSNSLTQLTAADNQSRQISGLDFDGNSIVWSDYLYYDGSSRIYLYDLSTSTPALIDNNAVNPKISDGKILYAGQGKWLTLYDISTKEKARLFSGVYGDGMWQVSGCADYDIDGDYTVCVSEYYPNPAFGILLHRISTGEEHQIGYGWSGGCGGMNINDDRIVWSDTYDILIFDIATGKTGRAGTVPSASLNPKVSGNIVAWNDYRAVTNTDIYMYKIDLQNQPTISLPTAPENICGLTGVAYNNGEKIAYFFEGVLDEPFGSLVAGMPFIGSFNYNYPQVDLSSDNPNRGDYFYQSISLTFGDTTVTDSGTGVINIYDSATYPTDLFHLYTLNVQGSFGGLTLAPSAGIQLVLQDVTGIVWSSTALPNAELAMANLTAGNATFVELQSAPIGSAGNIVSARGSLLSCAPVTPNQPPTVSEMGQYYFDNIIEIPEGGEIGSGNSASSKVSLKFRAKVSDPDNDRVKLRVFLQRFEEGSGNLLETISFKESDFVDNNEVATIKFDDLELAEGSYYWEIKAIDDKGNESEAILFGEQSRIKADFKFSNDFTFIHMTDVHLGSNYANVACSFGECWYEEWSYPRFTDALYEIETKVNPKPDFILIGGDNVEYAGTEDGLRWLKDFKAITDNFTQRTGIEIYVVPGNHDRYERPVGMVSEDGLAGGNDWLENYFKVINKLKDTTPLFPLLENSFISMAQGVNRYNYYFYNNGIKFIGLDSGEDTGIADFSPESAGISDEVMSLLENMDSTIPKIIFMHSPIFTGGQYPIEGNEYENESISNNRFRFVQYVNNKVDSSCINNNVLAVFSGHTHKNVIHNSDGILFSETPILGPIYVQTQSATKDKDNYKHGYRIIDVKNKVAPPRVSEKTETDFHNKIIADLDSSGNLDFKINNNNVFSFSPEDWKNVPSLSYFVSSASKRVILYEDIQNSTLNIENNNSIKNKYSLFVSRNEEDFNKPVLNFLKNTGIAGFKINNNKYCQEGELAEKKCKGGLLIVYNISPVSGKRISFLNFKGMDIKSGAEDNISITWSSIPIPILTWSFSSLVNGVLPGVNIKINGDSNTTLEEMHKKITIQLLSPGQLQVIDSNGRVSGLVNGEVKEEIPHSIYDEMNEAVILFVDRGIDDNQYLYKVVGTDNAYYGLTITKENKTGEVKNIVSFDGSSIPTTPGQIHQYSIDWDALANNEKGVTMEIDKEGDGTFEQTVNVGATFSDTIAPTSDISMSGTKISNGWYASDVWIELAAQDNEGGAGVKKIEYSLDNGGTWREYGEPFAVSGYGEYTIMYKSEDWFGNVEEAKSVSFRVVTARELLQDAQTQLNGLELDNIIKQTLKQLEQALKDDFWQDNNHLTKKGGESVSAHLKNAIRHLNGEEGLGDIKDDIEIAVEILTMFNENNVSSSGSDNNNSGGGIISTTLPTNASIAINNGESNTASANVNLALSASNVAQMAISNSPNFDGVGWEDYKTSKKWILTSGAGEKTVYAKFRSSTGGVSSVISDTIILNPNSKGKVFGATTTEITDGDIIQCKSCSNPFAVYVVKIKGDTKYIRHIVSVEIFNHYKHLKWENLKQVSSLSPYSMSGWVRYNTGANGTAGPNDKVYEINGDRTKHWVNMTAEQFLSRGGSDPAIYTINQGELNLYTAGPDVMSL